MDLTLFHQIMQVIVEKQSDKWTIQCVPFESCLLPSLLTLVHASEPHTSAWEMAKNARQIMRMCGIFTNAAEVTTVGVQWHGGPPARWDVPEDTYVSVHPPFVFPHLMSTSAPAVSRPIKSVPSRGSGTW